MDDLLAGQMDGTSGGCCRDRAESPPINGALVLELTASMFGGDSAPKAAGEVLSVFDLAGPQDGAVEPSDFKRKLIELIKAADAVNAARLSIAFPLYVAAVSLADAGDVNQLIAVARQR